MEKSKVRSVEIVSVIKIETCAGKGTEEDPNRIEVSYWTLEGALLTVL